MNQRERNKLAQRKWRAEHRDKVRAATKTPAARARNREFQRKYAGLPKPTRPEPKQCECCGRTPNRSLCLDHDHRTGRFRGWLCINCNTGIGSLGDTFAGLKCAMQYLNKAELS